MHKAAFLDSLRIERERWEALLADVNDAWMSEPGAAGDWSIKDIIAHIAWHEGEMIGVLVACALAGSELWSLPLDERNDAIYRATRHRSVPDVLAESHDTYRRLYDLLQAVSDEDLNDPHRFRDMPVDWQPWKLIAENTFEHYADHRTSLQAWLDRRKGSMGGIGRDA